MGEDGVKDTMDVPIGPIHKLINENAKSNSMVLKVISRLSFLVFFGTDYIRCCNVLHINLTNGLAWFQNRNQMQ